MKIDLTKIFAKQVRLDKTIHTNHNVYYTDTLDKLKLALRVELAELANEVRCFKFWSLKKRSDDHTVLMELVDCVHFITSLSIALDGDTVLNIDDNFLDVIDDSNQLTKIFNSLFDQTNIIVTTKQVNEIYKSFLILTYNLGYDVGQLLKAYDEKNKINHERQNNKY